MKRDGPDGRAAVGDAAAPTQSVKFQVITVLPPTVAMPMPIRRAFGFRMLAMWLKWPGYGSAMNCW